MKLINYFKNIFLGLWHLMQGMYITLLNMCRPKVTEQYPENRGTYEYGERFRALLTMPHDEENHHKCIACGMCMSSCPNGTVQVIAKTETDPVTGKPKRVLDKHLYNLGSCIFCGLCVAACPTGAIRFTNHFEHAVFTKERLLLQLNRPGSSQAAKPAPAPKPAPAAAAATTERAETKTA